MALKKSDLYSSLWASCDQLRGGMDASQYKDYILTLLFVKYVSDKAKADPESLIDVPTGGSFDDMLLAKGDKEIGDRFNKIIGKLAEANNLQKVIDLADFNDEEKLGKGKEMQDRLSKLVTIFADLDFRGSRAEGDDLLGDAYEYLMRHFATESGKSKGQFYTPAEVSRILAKVVGIDATTRQDDTVYDPTCGSGSLLLKVAAEAPRGVTIYGQEKDNATWALSKMNMILHGNEVADIAKGDTITSPQFTSGDRLRTFDFAVANPPFSVKSWSNGLENSYGRFEFGTPPEKNGDYAFLLHILKSLKSTGKGAVILPHGVLFRGNAEAGIRKRLLEHGFIKGIIGLPANLFYGTGIPACIVVLDKENAQARTGVFMIDASKGFAKDGPKNRLRSQDIHKIVDVFNKQIEIERYSRMVPLGEIAEPKNDFNLSIPRYVDSSEPEDLQDLEAHLQGGIPESDLDSLGAYWDAFPRLRRQLFKPNRAGYSDLTTDVHQVQRTVLESDEFQHFVAETRALTASWFDAHRETLLKIDADTKPNDLIGDIGDDLLTRFQSVPLLDAYDVYEQLMTYWHSVVHDDVFLIMNDGWVGASKPRKAIEDKSRKLAETPDIVVGAGRSASKYKTDLIPPATIVARYFAEEQTSLETLTGLADQASLAVESYVEEHAVEDGLLAEALDDDKISKAMVAARLRIARREGAGSDEIAALGHLIDLYDTEVRAKQHLKEAESALALATLRKYGELTEDEVKCLVLDDKWQSTICDRVTSEVNALTLALVVRVQQLGVRYAETLPELDALVDALNVEATGTVELPNKSRLKETLIGDFATFAKGKGLPKSALSPGGATPCIHYGELFTQYGPVIHGAHSRTDIDASMTSVDGDVLMPTSDVTPRGLAKASALLQSGVVLGGDILVIRPNPAIVDSRFLARAIRANASQVLALVRGSTVYHLYASDMKNFVVLLPPKDEQVRIADALDRADQLVSVLERRTAKSRWISEALARTLIRNRERVAA